MLVMDTCILQNTCEGVEDNNASRQDETNNIFYLLDNLTREYYDY